MGTIMASDGGGGATREELNQVVEWANNTVVDAAALRGVLKGLVIVAVDREAEDLVFKAATDEQTKRIRDVRRVED
jgi:hypothetical protein